MTTTVSSCRGHRVAEHADKRNVVEQQEFGRGHIQRDDALRVFRDADRVGRQSFMVEQAETGSTFGRALRVDSAERERRNCRD